MPIRPSRRRQVDDTSYKRTLAPSLVKSVLKEVQNEGKKKFTSQSSGNV